MKTEINRISLKESPNSLFLDTFGTDCTDSLTLLDQISPYEMASRLGTGNSGGDPDFLLGDMDLYFGEGSREDDGRGGHEDNNNDNNGGDLPGPLDDDFAFGADSGLDADDDVDDNKGTNNNNDIGNGSNNDSFPRPANAVNNSFYSGVSLDSSCTPSQTDTLDANFPKRAWHSDENDKGARQSMIIEIARLLKSRKKTQPSNEWLQQLPHKARKLEERLYRAAPSMSAYQDVTTLKNRLRKVAQVITTQYTAAKKRNPFALASRNGSVFSSSASSALSSMRSSLASQQSSQTRDSFTSMDSMNSLNRRMGGESAVSSVPSQLEEGDGARTSLNLSAAQQRNQSLRSIPEQMISSLGGSGRGGALEGSGRGGALEGSGRGGALEGSGRGGALEGSGRGGALEGSGRGGAHEGSGRGGGGSLNNSSHGPSQIMGNNNAPHRVQIQPHQIQQPNNAMGGAPQNQNNSQSMLEQQKAINEKLRMEIQESIRRQNELFRQLQQKQNLPLLSGPQQLAGNLPSHMQQHNSGAPVAPQQQRGNSTGINQMGVMGMQTGNARPESIGMGSSAPSHAESPVLMSADGGGIGSQQNIMAAAVRNNMSFGMASGGSVSTPASGNVGMSGFPFAAQLSAVMNNPNATSAQRMQAAKMHAALIQQQQQQRQQNWMNSQNPMAEMLSSRMQQQNGLFALQGPQQGASGGNMSPPMPPPALNGPMPPPPGMSQHKHQPHSNTAASDSHLSSGSFNWS